MNFAILFFFVKRHFMCLCSCQITGGMVHFSLDSCGYIYINILRSRFWYGWWEHTLLSNWNVLIAWVIKNVGFLFFASTEMQVFFSSNWSIEPQIYSRLRIQKSIISEGNFLHMCRSNRKRKWESSNWLQFFFDIFFSK